VACKPNSQTKGNGMIGQEMVGRGMIGRGMGIKVFLFYSSADQD
jgi:hypothetical protein